MSTPRALPVRFYDRPAQLVAPELLGARIYALKRGRTVWGRIVEVEAYCRDDEACHASRGMTRRNASMFGPPGTAYVYRIHRSFCLNLVCGPAGVGEAVLLRAIEPRGNVELMQRRRRGARGRLIASGPGRLCEALGVDIRLDGCRLRGPALLVAPGRPPERIRASPRIGISRATELLLRFVDADSEYLSR